MIDGLVSIITPCYNGEKFIRETIESVIGQTYENWEMIIVDDGSKDKSEIIITEYSLHEPRIKYVRQENSGSASARNNGINKAEGRYLALLDADDVWHKDFLEKQISFLKSKNATLVCCAYNRIDENSNIILKPTTPKEIITIKDMRKRNHIGCLTGLYDMSKYGKVYLHEELKSIRDDYAFWYDVISLSGCAYGNAEILVDYRVIKSSITGQKRSLIIKQYLFYRSYLKESPIEAIINTIRWGGTGLRAFGYRAL